MVMVSEDDGMSSPCCCHVVVVMLPLLHWHQEGMEVVSGTLMARGDMQVASGTWAGVPA